MTPLLLHRNEVDDTQWNNAIGASREVVMYAFSWYLDRVCEDWVAIVWPSRTEYQVVMPLPVKKKWGVPVVYQPFFCQYLGFFAAEIPEKNLIRDFLSRADSYTDFISGYTFSPQNQELVSDVLTHFPHWERSAFYTHWLTLVKGYEAIASGYSQGRRMNLKRSKREEWEIEKSENITALLDLFRRNHEGQIEGGIRQKTYDTLAKLLQYMLESGYGEILYANGADERVAGIFIGKAGGKAIYIFNAANAHGRRGNARTFLLDHYFQCHAGEDLIFDFESPDVPFIAGFYKSFGAESRVLVSVNKNTLSFPWKQFRQWRVICLEIQKRIKAALGT